MSMTWFKLHHDLPDDIKLRRFAPQEKWAWVVLLCLASKSSTRGIIHADDDDIAEYCEFNCTQDWLYYRDKLIAKGMLEIDASGGLAILHWADRQYDKPSDRPEAVKARVDKHRAKQKAVKEQSETPCNALHNESNALKRTDKTRKEEIRQEEKREEKSREELNTSFADANILESPEVIDALVVVSPEEKTPPAPPPAATKWQRFQDAYNEHKPAAWSRMVSVTKDRQRAMKKLEAECGGVDAAIVCLVNALAFAKGDRFWGGNKMGFDNLTRDGRVIQFHENYMASQSRPQAFNDFVDNPANVKFAENRDRLLRVIQNTSA